MDDTIKALQWKLLYGNHRAELGERWHEMAQATGAPRDVKRLPLDRDVPAEPFNRALVYLDEHLGEGDGDKVREIGAESAARWATMYRTLVAEMEGRPGPMLDLFCREVHPWFINDPTGAEVLRRGGDRAVVRVGGALRTQFKAGLLVGFARLTGVEATVTVLDDHRFEIAWTGQGTQAPSNLAVLARATRVRFLTATLLPVLVGTALAWAQGHLDAVRFGMTVAGAAFLHLSANALNDILDHVRGVDPANLTPTPFSGGSRTLQLGLLGLGGMATLAGFLGLAGIAIGLVLVAWAGPQVLLLGLAGVGLAVAYSVPPVRLADRGWGELTVGLVFGPLITGGAFLVQAGHVSAGALLAGVPVGLLWAATLLTNELPDAPWDARTGRRTLAVRLGAKAAWGHLAFTAGAYLAVAALALTGVVPTWSLLALATLPLAAITFKGVRAYWQDPDALVPYQGLTLVLHATTGLLLTAGIGLEVAL